VWIEKSGNLFLLFTHFLSQSSRHAIHGSRFASVTGNLRKSSHTPLKAINSGALLGEHVKRLFLEGEGNGGGIQFVCLGKYDRMGEGGQFAWADIAQLTVIQTKYHEKAPDYEKFGKVHFTDILSYIICEGYALVVLPVIGLRLPYLQKGRSANKLTRLYVLSTLLSDL